MRLSAIALTLPLGIVACSAAPVEPSVTGAWVRLPAVAGRPAAGYFTLLGGSADRTLVSMATPAAARVELHESMGGDGGMAGMRALPQVAVPAGQTVAFAPGGRHAMLFDVALDLAPGTVVPVTLMFHDGTRIGTNARLVGAGDPAPE